MFLGFLGFLEEGTGVARDCGSLYGLGIIIASMVISRKSEMRSELEVSDDDICLLNDEILDELQ
jgi:hypothetical protein